MTLARRYIDHSRNLPVERDPVHLSVVWLDRIAEGIEKLATDSDELVKSVRGRYVDSPQVSRIMDNIDQTTTVVSRDVEPLIKDAKEALANVERLTKTVSGPEEQAKIKSAIGDIAALANHAKVTAADAQAIVSHIRHGQGSVGAMVMDEQLYDDIQELTDLKHNPGSSLREVTAAPTGGSRFYPLRWGRSLRGRRRRRLTSFGALLVDQIPRRTSAR